MKKVLVLIVVSVLAYGVVIHERSALRPQVSSSIAGADSVLEQAFVHHESNLQVQGEGTVIRILPDDLRGSRHQRFILRLASGQTLLVAHNIDLAPRLEGLKPGDTVEFFGEYEWNPKGGVLHWTHHDPNGRHVAGWLKYRGQIYE